METIKQFITKALLKSVVRHALTAAAGALVMHGFASNEQVQLIMQAVDKLVHDPVIASAGLALVAIGHSALEKRKQLPTAVDKTVTEQPAVAPPEPLQSPKQKE